MSAVKRVRRGFTLLELMVVVSIIAILVSIVMTATAGALKYSRETRTSAICKCVKEGLEAYRFQKDEWPGSIQQGVDSQSNGGNNTELNGQTINRNKYVAPANVVKEAIYEVVKESVTGNPLMDVSGLYVSRDSGEPGHRIQGTSFMEAVRVRHWRVGDMYYGYPESSTGYFRRLKIAIAADSAEVTK